MNVFKPAAAGPPIDVFLCPGEYAVGDARHRLRTLLGSCVSITLWHPGRRIGAMSHFLLAARAGGPHRDEDGRYGEEALPLMLQALAARGVPVADCVAKLFGGADMFPAPHRGCDSIGRRNGEAARRLLAGHGLVARSESLFGVGHRQLVFEVATGDVWVRQVAPETQPASLWPALDAAR